MSNAIIDVGSNSVRLLFNGKKYMENTQLAENLMNSGVICDAAAERTRNAVKSFVGFAKNGGAENVYAFATEAVRAAKNGKEFAESLLKTGAKVEILPSRQEAETGFCGAYPGEGTVAVLDIGGASSELAVGDRNGLRYAHSLPLGSVRLKDYAPCAEKQATYAAERVREYGEVPEFDKLIAIGGTLSQLCAVMKELDPYDPEKVHNTVMTKDDVKAAVEKILAVPVEERTKIKGLHPKKILVAPAGGILALAIMDYLKITRLTVSEKDNLEGYAKLKNIEL